MCAYLWCSRGLTLDRPEFYSTYLPCFHPRSVVMSLRSEVCVPMHSPFGRVNVSPGADAVFSGRGTLGDRPVEMRTLCRLHDTLPELNEVLLNH